MTIKQRFRSLGWIASGFFKKHKRTLLISGLIGVLGFVFITKILPLLPQPKPTVRVGMVGLYSWETLPDEVHQKIGLGLTTIMEDGSVAPALAERWETSDKGKVYTFYLRENISWQDGTPLKASQLVYPFTDVEITSPDDRTIQFRLKEPFAPFPAIVGTAVFKDQRIGTGPYELRNLKKKGDVVEKVNLTGPKLNYAYRFYPTLSAAAQGFTLGEVDVLQDVFEVPFGPEWQNDLVIEKRVRFDQYIGAFFNLQHPLLGDKTVRQALAYATKKDYGGLKRAISPINPQSWAFNPEVKTYDFDADRARELFDKVFTEDEAASASAQHLPKKSEVELTILTTPTLLGLAEQIKATWEEALGIKVQVQTTNTVSGDFDILLIGQEIFPDPDQYPLWHSTQPQNLTHYQSPKVDKLLEDARQILDQSKRKEGYFDFQRFLVEDTPVLFLYHPETYTISRQRAVARQ